MRISDWSSDVCSSDLGPKSSSLCSPLSRRFAPPSPAGGRRVGVGSLRGLGKLLVQHLADFLLHRALQRGQQETELRGHVQLLGGHGDPAVDAAAVEMHLVAVPVVLEAEFVGQLPGHVFHPLARSEEHTSELQSLMRISYDVFCLKKK